MATPLPSDGARGGQGATSSTAVAPSCTSAVELEPEECGEAAIAAALAACEEGGSGASNGASVNAMPRPIDDPALALPVSSRTDWEAEMIAIRATIDDPTATDEDRIRTVHEALMQRIEDTRVQEESKTGAIRRLEEASKERERCRVEIQRTLAVKAKLEGSCRELQQQKFTISKENQHQRRRAEQAHRAQGQVPAGHQRCTGENGCRA